MPPPTKLREGIVFRGVCLSRVGGGGPSLAGRAVLGGVPYSGGGGMKGYLWRGAIKGSSMKVGAMKGGAILSRACHPSGSAILGGGMKGYLWRRAIKGGSMKVGAMKEDAMKEPSPVDEQAASTHPTGMHSSFLFFSTFLFT